MDKEIAQHITIREAVLNDLAEIVTIYNQGIEDGNANCELGFYTAQDRLAWFNNRQGRFPIWVAESEGRVLGWTCLSQYEPKGCFDRTATFSTYVDRNHRGQGLGSKLREHLIEQAKKRNFHVLVNRVFVINSASIALAEKYGFERVGHFKELVRVNDRYLDCVFYQKILS